MVDRTENRAFRRPALEEASEPEQPVVTPALVELLEKSFGGLPEPLRDMSLEGAVNLALRVARRQGQEDVLSFLESLVKNPSAEDEA